MGQVKHPFFDMFPICGPGEDADGGILSVFREAVVFDVALDREAGAITVSVEVKERPAPVAVSMAEARIADYLQLSRAEVQVWLPKAAKKQGDSPKTESKLLWGRKPRGKAVPIAGLTPESIGLPGMAAVGGFAGSIFRDFGRRRNPSRPQ